MKRMKIALMAMIAIFMGTTFTSCLDSDNENSYDIADNVTLWDNYGTKYYVCENYGYRITPTNGSSVFPNGYPERGLFYFKLAEGQVITEGKTDYQASVVGGESYFVKNFCNRLDTLQEKSAPFSQIKEGGWTTKGPGYDYLNTGFIAIGTTNSKMEFFNLYPEDVDGSTLYMRLFHDEEIGNNVSTQTYDIFMNFKLPNARDLEDMLGREKYNELSFIGTTRDSVNIVLRANGTNDSKLESKPIKAKIYSY